MPHSCRVRLAAPKKTNRAKGRGMRFFQRRTESPAAARAGAVVRGEPAATQREVDERRDPEKDEASQCKSDEDDAGKDKADLNVTASTAALSFYSQSDVEGADDDDNKKPAAVNVGKGSEAGASGGDEGSDTKSQSLLPSSPEISEKEDNGGDDGSDSGKSKSLLMDSPRASDNDNDNDERKEDDASSKSQDLLTFLNSNEEKDEDDEEAISSPQDDDEHEEQDDDDEGDSTVSPALADDAERPPTPPLANGANSNVEEKQADEEASGCDSDDMAETQTEKPVLTQRGMDDGDDNDEAGEKLDAIDETEPEAEADGGDAKLSSSDEAKKLPAQVDTEIGEATERNVDAEEAVTKQQLWAVLDKELRSNIGGSVQCHVCKSTVQDPVLTPCTHSFCRDCITQHIQQLRKSKASKIQCPTCNQPITKRSLQDFDHMNGLASGYKEMLRVFGLCPAVPDPTFMTLTQAEVMPESDGEEEEDAVDDADSAVGSRASSCHSPKASIKTASKPPSALRSGSTKAAGAPKSASFAPTTKDHTAAPAKKSSGPSLEESRELYQVSKTWESVLTVSPSKTVFAKENKQVVEANMRVLDRAERKVARRQKRTRVVDDDDIDDIDDDEAMALEYGMTPRTTLAVSSMLGLFTSESGDGPTGVVNESKSTANEHTAPDGDKPIASEKINGESDPEEQKKSPDDDDECAPSLSSPASSAKDLEDEVLRMLSPGQATPTSKPRSPISNVPDTNATEMEERHESRFHHPDISKKLPMLEEEDDDDSEADDDERPVLDVIPPQESLSLPTASQNTVTSVQLDMAIARTAGSQGTEVLREKDDAIMDAAIDQAAADNLAEWLVGDGRTEEWKLETSGGAVDTGAGEDDENGSTSDEQFGTPNQHSESLISSPKDYILTQKAPSDDEASADGFDVGGGGGSDEEKEAENVAVNRDKSESQVYSTPAEGNSSGADSYQAAVRDADRKAAAKFSQESSISAGGTRRSRRLRRKYGATIEDREKSLSLPLSDPPPSHQSGQPSKPLSPPFHTTLSPIRKNDDDDSDGDDNDAVAALTRPRFEADADIASQVTASPAKGADIVNDAVKGGMISTKRGGGSRKRTRSDDDSISASSDDATFVESKPPPRAATPATPISRAVMSPGIRVGSVVVVTSRTWSGINKPGGTGRVTGINENGTYDVKYVLGGRERSIEAKFVRAVDGKGDSDEGNLNRPDDVSTSSMSSANGDRRKRLRSGAPASAAVFQTPESEFAVGDVVKVESRMWPGINKPGGVARIAKVNNIGNDSAECTVFYSYDVAYILGGKESGVSAEYITSHDEAEKDESRLRNRDAGGGEGGFDGLPLELLVVLAAQGYNTGVSVPASGSKDKQKRIPKPTKATKRKQAASSLDSVPSRKRSPKAAPVAAAPVKRKRPKSAPAWSSIPVTDVRPMGAKEISEAADATYDHHIKAMFSKATVHMISSNLDDDDSKRLNALIKVLKKDGVKLKLSDTLSQKSTAICLMHAETPKGRSDKSFLTSRTRTVKAMRSALAGIPIVSQAWLAACEESRKLLLPEPDMFIRALPIKTPGLKVNEASAVGVAAQAASRGINGTNIPSLLSGVTIAIQGSISQAKRGDMALLTKESGAELLSSPSSVVAKLKSISAESAGSGKEPSSLRIVILCTDSFPGAVTGAMDREIRAAVDRSPGSVLVAEAGWLFDSITCGCPLQGDAHEPGSAKAKELWHVCINK